MWVNDDILNLVRVIGGSASLNLVRVIGVSPEARPGRSQWLAGAAGDNPREESAG